ncbi:hypothetical protein JCM3765_002703 [Sporobolomyces pararoseus]
MTSLDPNHFPGLERTSDPTTGQSIRTSISEGGGGGEPNQSQPSWKGAWKRRQEAKERARREKLGLDDSDQEEEEDEDKSRGDGKIPIPPIPDLRYEQGILSSIKPFLHTTSSKATTRGKKQMVEKRETEKHEEKFETIEKTVLASSQLTAGHGRDTEVESGSHQSDALMSGGLRIEWGMVTYVLFRDQVIFPLLQGVLWGMAGIYLNGLWEWNRERLAAKNLAQRGRTSGPGLLSRLGLRV